MSRFVFAEAPRVRAEWVALKMQGALVKLARKYSPDQPRVPAGSAGGGQWTDGGGTRVAANDRGEGAIATDASIKPKPRPSYAVSYQAGDGTRFDAPPKADFQKMYEYGQSLQGKSLAEQKAAIGAAIGQGGIFDFQRENGKFIDAYRDASNYGAGVLMNGTGASWFKTVTAGTWYGLTHSDPLYDARRPAWWYRGYQDAKYSRLPKLDGK